MAWLRAHAELLALLGVGSIVLLVTTAIMVPWLVVRLPADYFVNTHPQRSRPHTIARVLRNVLGVVTVLLGIIMLVLPGQGLLTIIVGLLWIDFPGKKRLIRRLIRRPRINRTIAWLRRRAGGEPLQL